MSTPIKLPCLKGRMGDWIYYVSLLNFKELAARTSMVPEIHKNQELSRWIQREVSDRSGDIVTYLKEQPQRFFNSVICGIYGGKPQWQELDIEGTVANLTEVEKDYLDKTFGILSLSGEEKIFAIDGQHRTKAIKEYIKDPNVEAEKEEVTVILLAHKNSLEGEIRTRRLFSTLNRYAVPVSISEIIALDEEDNCAIITRILMEDFDFFNNKIKFSKTKSISAGDTSYFTNIVLLYELVSIILTNKSFSTKIKFDGYDYVHFTRRRESEENISKEVKKVQNYFIEIVRTIPSLNNFFKENTPINRDLQGTNLIFRPIGQLVAFYVIKIAEQQQKKRQALKYFAKDSFNLSNRSWKKVFYDKQTKTIKTDKKRQTLAIQLILKHIGIDVKMTLKEKEFMNSVRIDVSTI